MYNPKNTKYSRNKMNLTLAFIIYNIIYTILFPFVVLFLAIHAIFSKKVRDGNLYRLGLKKPKKSEECVWVHAVSVGEVKAVEKLIDLIYNRGENIYLSTTTEAGYKTASSIYKDKVNLFYFPLDTVLFINSIIKRIKPKLIIVAEIEIWPNFIYFSKKNKIDIHLVNGRIGEKELKGYGKAPLFFKPFFECYKTICAQSKPDYEKMLKIGMPKDKLKISGNLKYDISYDVSDSKYEEAVSLLPKDKTILVCGSTHEGEESLIINALLKTKNIFPVIVPREIERANSIVKILSSYGFNTVLKSETKIYANYTALVVDTIGDLLSFYKVANLVVMGGTFSVNVGGHNILEPAYFKKPVIVGPYTHNFLEMTEYFEKHDGIYKLHNNAEIDEAINTLLTNEEKRKQIGEKAKSLIDANKGASAYTYKTIFGE